MSEEDKRIIDSFLGHIKEVRPRIDGIYLFGSRARGRARPDSDYDLLLIVPRKNKELKDKLYDAAVEVLMESGADISLKIVEKKDFERMTAFSLPFVENVLKEGIKLG